MRIVRSFPNDPDMYDGRHPLIMDDAEIINIDATRDYINYRPLIEIGESFIHLDWDIAVGRDELRAFARKCRSEPNRIWAGPYRMQPTRLWRRGSHPGTKPHWHVWKHYKGKWRELQPGEPWCHRFGMGFVYIPFEIWEAYTESQNNTVCGAFGLSAWYRENVEDQIPVDWDLNLVHLNYSIRHALEGKT